MRRQKIVVQEKSKHASSPAIIDAFGCLTCLALIVVFCGAGMLVLMALRWAYHFITG